MKPLPLIKLQDTTVCFYCRRPYKGGRDKTKDHIIPKSKGGGSSIYNLLYCCGRCNRRKGDADPYTLKSLIIKIYDGHQDTDLLEVPRGLVLSNIDTLISYLDANKPLMLKAATWDFEGVGNGIKQNSLKAKHKHNVHLHISMTSKPFC